MNQERMEDDDVEDFQASLGLSIIVWQSLLGIRSFEQQFHSIQLEMLFIKVSEFIWVVLLLVAKEGGLTVSPPDDDNRNAC